MIFAVIQIELWQVAAGIVTILLVKGLEYLTTFLNYKRDQAAENTKSEYLRSIAATNMAQAQNIAQLNIHLATANVLTEERHAQSIRTMQALCKANCANFQQQQQPTGKP